MLKEQHLTNEYVIIKVYTAFQRPECKRGPAIPHAHILTRTYTCVCVCMYKLCRRA